MHRGVFVDDETYFTILTPLASAIPESVGDASTVCQ